MIGTGSPPGDGEKRESPACPALRFGPSRDARWHLQIASRRPSAPCRRILKGFFGRMHESCQRACRGHSPDPRIVTYIKRRTSPATTTTMGDRIRPTASAPRTAARMTEAGRPRKKSARCRALAGKKSRERENWRRRRDSNPRYRFRYTPLAGERLRPLGHLSARGFTMRQSLRLQGLFDRHGEMKWSMRPPTRFSACFRGIFAGRPVHIRAALAALLSRGVRFTN
jgi:hypothetical protein